MSQLNVRLSVQPSVGLSIATKRVTERATGREVGRLSGREAGANIHVKLTWSSAGLTDRFTAGIEKKTRNEWDEEKEDDEEEYRAKGFESRSDLNFFSLVSLENRLRHSVS